MSILNEIKYRFKNGSIVEQLIFIFVGISIFTALAGSFCGLSGRRMTFFTDWFALSPSFDLWLNKPWTLVTFGFLHDGFLHILFNCIALYLFGRLFLDFFTPKQLLTFFLLGTVFGGMMFMLSYHIFPVLANRYPFPIVGASAGVSAIMIGLATYIPNYQLRFRFIGDVKVWHIAAFFIFMDLISLAGDNGGGHFSHLGGALFGYLYISLAGGKKWDFFDVFSSIFRRKRTPLKTAYNSKKKKTQPSRTVKSDTQQQIDTILDKISTSGYDTLSKEEKEFLFKQRK